MDDLVATPVSRMAESDDGEPSKTESWQPAKQNDTTKLVFSHLRKGKQWTWLAEMLKQFKVQARWPANPDVPAAEIGEPQWEMEKKTR